MLRRLVSAIRGTLRYKLLFLVLFPILLIMPVALGLAIYWGSTFTYEQLLIKVNTDLSVSRDVFRRIREDYLGRLASLAESYDFHTALEVRNGRSIRDQLQQLQQSAGFSYLRVVDSGGRWLFGPYASDSVRARSSPQLLAASTGDAGVGVEVFSQQELLDQAPELAQQVRLPLVDTPRARRGERSLETRGMMIRALYPVMGSGGQVLAILDGGVLLNGNFDFVDAIRDLVYGAGSLPERSIGTVTVFLEDIRITTNVPLGPGERALGTRVSNEVRERVLDKGEKWIDRAFVVNDWYISGYEPIFDVEGRRVGMLNAGFLEYPFRLAQWRVYGVLVFMFLVLMAISALVTVLGAKSIFQPIETMSEVVRATRAGNARRVGAITSRDEIGELARELDGMLNLLQQRKRELQEWADQLENKVQARTAELQRKNADLNRTIRVLRETRQKLVASEKLAALGELTAGVAHEINNPAAVILGNLDLLVAQLGSAAAPVQQEIDLIIEQIYRIKDIIHHLLQYARPSQYAANVEEVNVNQVARDTLMLVRHLRSKMAFEIRLDLAAERRVRINKQELQQVLVNLTVNAVHALNKEGGVVRIETRDWKQRGVCIAVKDNGVGMAEELLGRIFNPFFSTKGRGGGSGLGLSISYSLIRSYGGNISVDSRPGGGSEFYVWLLAEPQMIEDEQTIAEQLKEIESASNG